MKDSWSFAGEPGGGGILDVASHEELEEIMAEFPFGPWSDVDIKPLSNLRESMAAMKKAMEAGA